MQHGSVGDGGEGRPQRGGGLPDSGHVQKGRDRLFLGEKPLCDSGSYGLIPTFDSHMPQPTTRGAPGASVD
ncbi:hypothetical protein GCM10010232_00670 [Streptomyces amakusaensis]